MFGPAFIRHRAKAFTWHAVRSVVKETYSAGSARPPSQRVSAAQWQKLAKSSIEFPIKTKSFWNGASTRLVAGGWIHNGKARKTRAGS